MDVITSKLSRNSEQFAGCCIRVILISIFVILSWSFCPAAVTVMNRKRSDTTVDCLGNMLIDIVSTRESLCHDLFISMTLFMSQ